ncbi:hypothetical protein [Cupriavidus basilensis]|uniref:hypothetical protein n=1 Tax=Cupriavidus basilensis TaxID=68895 RepID=UPI00157A88CA|nr:hypothetical protein [Cupriavidus basilensis]NUA29159.1 hypothetical protein [Cupriavidus basilensis]
MDQGSYVNRSEAESTTPRDVLERYIAEVCPSMRGGIEDSIRLRATCRTKLARLSMAALTPMAVAAYRDERLKQVKPGTVTAIETWAKSCTPLTAPTSLDGQIRAGNVAFHGVKVAAVDTADAGASSLVSVRFDMPSADFKAKFPEIAKTAKLPKSKTCPAGVQRSLADHSLTGSVDAEGPVRTVGPYGQSSEGIGEEGTDRG